MKKRARLYYFFAADCPGCAEIKDAIDEFERTNPDVEVIYWNVVDRPWTLKIKQPDATPALLCLDAKGARTLTGFVLPADAIAKWVRRQDLGDTIK